jgi:ribosomal protein S18 acetylase RimI-like enzyme
MADDYDLIQRAPTFEECLSLFLAVGWQEHISEHFVEINLTRSLVYVVIVHQNQVVGMGRIIRRKEVYYIENIAVHPQHQGKGLGRRIMTYLMEYLLQHALAYPDTRAFMYIAPGTKDFYAKFGFKVTDSSERYMHRYLYRETPEKEYEQD